MNKQPRNRQVCYTRKNGTGAQAKVADLGGLSRGKGGERERETETETETETDRQTEGARYTDNGSDDRCHL